MNDQDTAVQRDTCTNTIRPTLMENDAVGIDLLALGQQLPLPSTTKLGAQVQTWNDQFILVKLHHQLFLYDRANQSWIWLKTSDDAALTSDTRFTLNFNNM